MEKKFYLPLDLDYKLLDSILEIAKMVNSLTITEEFKLKVFETIIRVLFQYQ